MNYFRIFTKLHYLEVKNAKFLLSGGHIPPQTPPWTVHKRAVGLTYQLPLAVITPMSKTDLHHCNCKCTEDGLLSEIIVKMKMIT